MNNEPLSSNFSASISGGFGGSLPPSCHVNVQGGNSPRFGNSYFNTDDIGAISEVIFEDSTNSTLVGAPSFSAQFAPSMMWHAMSPSAPQPKSHQPRQLNGW